MRPIPSSEIREGIKVEHEHTGTLKKVIADMKAGELKPLSHYFASIVSEHNAEVGGPGYYPFLNKMEKALKKRNHSTKR